MTIFRKFKTCLCELPISAKIVAICAVSSFVTLIALCSFSVYQNWHEFKERKLSSLNTISEIMANHSQGALRFDSREEAAEQLASLKHEQDVLRAALFDVDGTNFANYLKDPTGEQLSAPNSEAILWLPGVIQFSRPIHLEGRSLGSLVIEVDTSPFLASAYRNIQTSIALLIGGMLISIFLASHMQRLIAQPIKDLESVSKTVRNSEDFSTRAQKHYNDEIGSLVDNFNSMLDKISESDASLREINFNLEQLVEQRTQDLRIQNLALKEAMDAAKAASIAKSEFLATTSHELRNPLNPIIGYVDKIQRDQPNGPHSKDLNLIKQSAEQLLRLIEDILDFSRIESGTLFLKEEKVDIEQLAADVVSILGQQSRRKGIGLTANHTDSCTNKETSCNVIIDQGRIRQILLNLTNNAIKFTHEGSVAVNTSITRKSESEANLLIEVIDTGIGIDLSDQKKLFKPFSQIDASWTREYGGMGLGLAICQRIIHAMGGSIQCESEKGAGSRFFATIPVKTCQGEPYENADDLNATFTLEAGFRILLVEDEPVNRELMDALLSSLGHQVTTANNGLEAVKQAKEAEFDFILLDISMPKMDGFAATRLIRALGNKNSNLPIVAMTAHVTPEDKDSCFDAGMNDYLSKPISFTKLKTTLAKWLDRKAIK